MKWRYTEVAKQKFYVVWAGRQTGVFDNWPEVQSSVTRFPGGRQKSFPTLAEAEAAWAKSQAMASVPTTSDAKTSNPDAQAPLSGSGLNPAFDIHIFCDGGCNPNPGEAGSGVVMYQSGELCEMYYGLYEPKGTNNTAELNALHMAMVVASDKLAYGLSVQILSDSTYAIGCMTMWGADWKSSGRMAGGGKKLLNRELIEKIFEFYLTIEESISIIHVNAHCGIEGNELADRMCTLAINGKVTGFESCEGFSVKELLALDSC